MDGQWIGKFTGTNQGTAMINIDDCGDHYEGNAFIIDEIGAPNFLASIRTKDKNPLQHLELPLFPLHPNEVRPLAPHEIAQAFPSVDVPNSASVKFEIKDGSLDVEWTTPVGTFGKATFPKSKADEPSEYVAEAGVATWDEFKRFAIRQPTGQFIFRGQSRPFRLRTSFHRTARKDMFRFMNEDIPALHRAVVARGHHLFNLTEGWQNAAFWSLVQHHGYPTPLLDWTHSPFVAAFFAFQPDRFRSPEDEHVRILMFDRKAWSTEFRQMEVAAPPHPHFSIMEAFAIENERAVRQQALSTITNVDDIESYIRTCEDQRKRRYLYVIDLKYNELESVHNELRLMGITDGALSPGLDGLCRELKAINFGIGV